jgi:predicted aspartyl protease
MGEIRVKVQITNQFDEMQARRGMIPWEEVRSYEADGVVDTGAVRSAVPPHVLDMLGVELFGQRVAGYADGRTEAVPLSESMLFKVMGRETQEEAFVLGTEVLIGQTILEKLDLLADCTNQRLVPNPAHPDQPVSKLRRRWEVYPPPSGSA